ncbi:MAG: VOC family protein [Steroidobacteraceae bacterium]|nr:VOC family protein [Steroidobacteraceae bacterium]
MGIFTHVCVGTNDVAKSRKFYDAALAPLGIKNLGPFGDSAFLYGAEGPEFLVTKPRDGQPATHANGGTIGFAASTRAAVKAFHAAALANGATDEGAPGPRTFTPTSYAAYVRDPDGNKICAYCFAAE